MMKVKSLTKLSGQESREVKKVESISIVTINKKTDGSTTLRNSKHFSIFLLTYSPNYNRESIKLSFYVLRRAPPNFFIDPPLL